MPKLVVEDADEGADGGGGVVVLGFAEQQGRAALDIAQVDVIAEADAFDLALAVDGQHHLGFGVVPFRDRVQADGGAVADRGHGRGLGEDLGIRADADLEILRPQVFGLEQAFDLGRLGRAGFQVAQAVADGGGDALADGVGAGGVAGGAFLDHPFDHRAGEGDAAGLDRLKVGGGEEVQAVGGGFGVVEGGQGGDHGAGGGGEVGGQVVAFQQVAHGGGGSGGDVDQVAVAVQGEGGADAGAPDAGDEGAGGWKVGHGRLLWRGRWGFHTSPPWDI